MSQICDKLKELVTILFKSKEEEKTESSVVQKQTAGEGATQVQAGTIVYADKYIGGIDENRAKEISLEIFEKQREVFTAEAVSIAKERVEKFETKLMDRISNIEGALNEFSKPEFQFMLGNTQRVAAATDRELDYDLLTELVVCRIEKGKQKKINAGLKFAASVVNDIDTDALCALTVAYAVGGYGPASGDVFLGLDALERLFEKLTYSELPYDNAWIEHLEMLNLIRVFNLTRLKKLEEFYCESFDGYICVGIRKDSEEYIKATSYLLKVGLPLNLLADNPLLEGFVRLPIVQRRRINELRIEGDKLIGDEEIKVLNDIWELYSRDSNLANEVKKRFIEEIDKRSHLSMVRTWWNKISLSFSIKQSGAILAHINAKRCDKNLPDFI